MADQYGLFFNSINGDRIYDADSFSEWLNKFFTTGVFNGELEVTADSGMAVTVASGYANINGKVRFFEQSQTFTLDPASGVYPRIDSIVVRLDTTNRMITTEYVKGDYSGNNPQPTEPTRTGGLYEIVLAQIYVSAGATQILTNDITDTRADDSVCGWVTSTVEGVPMDQIVSQMQAQFLTWFDEMKDQLSEDAAGHLQGEIDTINGTMTTVTDSLDTVTDVLDDMHYVTTFAVQPSDWVNKAYTFHDSHIVAMAYDDVSNITQMVYQEGLAPYVHKKAVGKADITLSNFVDGAFTMTCNGKVPTFAVRFYYEKIIYKEAE